MNQLLIVFHKIRVVEQNLRMLDGIVEVLNQPGHPCCIVMDLYLVLGTYRSHTVGRFNAFFCISFIINIISVDFDGQKIAQCQIIVHLQVFGIILQNLIIDDVGI